MSVIEPSLPRRVRRPVDGAQLLVTLAALGVVLLLPSVARQTTSGLQSDITHGTAQAPHFVLVLANLVSTFGLLAVPVLFAVERLIRRDRMRVAIGVLAAVIALGVTLALDLWVAAGPGGIAGYLSWTRRAGAPVPDPLHTDLTPVIAYVTAVRLGGRPRWQGVTWGVIGLAALAALAAGYASPLALAVTYLIGRAIGYGTLYAVGTPNPRPPGTEVIAALRRLGFEARGASRVMDGPEETRRYVVELAGGPGDGHDDRRRGAKEGDVTGVGTGDGADHRGGRRLSVTVLDRDQQTSGFLYRAWRRLRLRSGSPRLAARSLRRSLEQEALMSYAVTAAAARTPRLVATSEVGTDAVLLAFEHVPGVGLAELPRERITNDLLTAIWHQLALLDAHRLAHRHLEAGSILVGEDEGVPYLVELRSGEIASSDLLRRLDLAQLLTTLALLVGPERAVSTGADVLGADRLVTAVPLLQNVALSRGTRAALRHERDLLSRIREQVLRLSPEVAPAPPERLERFRPRTVLSIVAGAAAGYFLLSQLSSAGLRGLFSQADWWWAGAGLVSAGTTYVAAAMMITGFVPERLPFVKTVLVQLAGSFIKLMAPAAVTVVALNARYLQREGVRPGPAVASVGASQLVGMMIHIGLLIVFGFMTGSAEAESLAPSRTVVIVLLACAVVAGAVTTVPPARRLVIGRLRAMFSGVVPRLLDVLQTPRKVVTGLGGTLLLTASFVLCLDASIRAFGGSIGWTTVVIVFLTGNALGSAVPTPGGLGAIEGALTLGLTVGGLPAGTATSAVLLFRLLTFWLPVLPGWAAFAYLQRKEAV
ncbi:MAG TPA: lysylphosphatidylglycerol synthase transmembrane domain-containing protein [Streptosporangiaceae bacterium]